MSLVEDTVAAKKERKIRKPIASKKKEQEKSSLWQESLFHDSGPNRRTLKKFFSWEMGFHSSWILSHLYS
jgi:hypothetical protein